MDALTVILSAILLFSLAIPHASAITAKTNRTLYIPLDSLYVAGVASANYQVSISVTSPSGNLVAVAIGVAIGTLPQGNYNITVMLFPSTNSTAIPYGKYTLRSTDTYTGESMTMTIIFAPQRLALSPNQGSYLANEIVFAFGIAPPDDNVAISVANPSGNLVSASQGKANLDGKYNITLLRLPSTNSTTFPYGSYSLKASISSDGTTVNAIIRFTDPVSHPSPLPRFQQVPVSTPRITDSFGKPIFDIKTNDLVAVEATAKNNDTVSHSFVFLVQVRDSNMVVDSLGWIRGLSLDAGTTLTPGLSWKPSKGGTYTIEVFIWDALDYPIALSPVARLTVNVA